MSIIASAHGEYEVAVRLGTPAAELIRTLRGVPGEAELTDHFGDVDLVIVLRVPREAPRPADG